MKAEEQRPPEEGALLLSGTFVAAQLDVGKQADLDDLPQEAQDQVRLPLLQVLSSDVHHLAADGRGRVQSQVEVLLGRRWSENRPTANDCE